jgi:cAMP-dependent protein kinase regulator
MSLPPAYTAILSDLNRDVLRSQPSDVLQFCANWFAARLEADRIHQRSDDEASAMHSASPSASAEASAPKGAIVAGAAGAGALMGLGLAKSAQTSVAGQEPYTFGGPARSAGGAISPRRTDGMDVEDGTPSPFAVGQALRKPPSAPTSPVSRSPTSQSPSGIPASHFPGTVLDYAGPGAASSAPALAADEDDEDVYDPRDNPDYHLSPASDGPSGIPAAYNLGRRTSVSAESLSPSTLPSTTPKTVIPKTPSQRSRIEQSIASNLLFRNLDEAQHDDVMNAMKEVSVPKGTEVIVQGAVGDFFYVVEAGTFEVWVRAPPTHTYAGPGNSTTTPGEEKQVATYGPGGSFGELALMYNAPRAATVVATSEATMWALDRVTFRSILMEHTSRKRKMYESFLSEVPLLSSLNTKERSKIADALEEKVYEEGESVVVEGEVGKNFYIIESGKAEVLKKRTGEHAGEEVLGSLGKGDYFGGESSVLSIDSSLTALPCSQSSLSSTLLPEQQL